MLTMKAKLQFYASDRLSIHEQINHEAKQEQIRMRQGLLKQIAALKFLILIVLIVCESLVTHSMPFNSS